MLWEVNGKFRDHCYQFLDLQDVVVTTGFRNCFDVQQLFRQSSDCWVGVYEALGDASGRLLVHLADYLNDRVSDVCSLQAT